MKDLVTRRSEQQAVVHKFRLVGEHTLDLVQVRLVPRSRTRHRQVALRPPDHFPHLREEAVM
ncbi:MAG: hypothetical protein ACRDYA_04060 [Egibacteraceae bacterium]